MALCATKVFARGATIQFATTFYDVDGAVSQPNSATVHLAYESSAGEALTASVPMVAPSAPSVVWKAFWDTRDVRAPGIVYWSIHTGTGDPVPVAVEDGQFQLSANPANLVTF